MESFTKLLRDLGLTREEWYQLKNVVLESGYGRTMAIPEALAAHEVSLLVAEFQRSGNRKALDQAAVRLAGSADQPYLMLDKS